MGITQQSSNTKPSCHQPTNEQQQNAGIDEVVDSVLNCWRSCHAHEEDRSESGRQTGGHPRTSQASLGSQLSRPPDEMHTALRQLVAKAFFPKHSYYWVLALVSAGPGLE